MSNSRSKLVCTCLALFLLGFALRTEAALVWHEDAGWVDTAIPPDDTPASLFKYGVGLLVRGEVNTALEVLTALQKRDLPGELEWKVRFAEGECRLRRGEAERAYRILEEVFAKAPRESRGRVAAMQLKAIMQVAEDNVDRSADALRAFIKREPLGELNVEARVALAGVELRRGRHEAARAAYLQAAEISTNKEQSASALFGAAWTDLDWCRKGGHDPGKLQRALAQFKKYQDEHPQGAEAAKARECVWLCDSLLQERLPDRRKAYYDIVGILAGEGRSAYSELKRAARKYRATYLGEASQFYLAEYWFKQKEFWRAFKYYEKLMEEYPGSTRVRRVTDREFEIGRQLLAAQGKWRDRQLWRAADVFQQIVEHNPSGPKAPDAQYLLGECYLERWHWQEAFEAYRALIENYPRSAWLGAARFKSGVARFHEAEFTQDKSELLIQAKRALTVYLRNNPKGTFAKEANDYLQRCRYREAALKWRAVRFYERTKKPQAAVAVLTRITKDYGDTVWANRAQKRLGAYKELGYAK